MISVATLSDLASIDKVSIGSSIITVEDLSTGGLFIWQANGTYDGGITFTGLTGFWARQYDEKVNVKWFGAKGDGINDDTSAVMSAISYLSNIGGILFLPSGTYKISNRLTIGDGTSTTTSTKHGIIIIGESPIYNSSIFSGFQNNGGTRIVWAGGSDAMFSIDGPLQGWGIQNIILDGASLASVGILVNSAMFGDSKNLSFSGFAVAGILSSSYTAGGTPSSKDSLHNSYKNLILSLPDIPNTKGIIFTGQNGYSNTDYSDVSNAAIYFPGGSNPMTGIMLASCDSCHFSNIHFFGGGSGTVGINLDYTINPAWPASCTFEHIDTSGANIGWVNSGTPNQYARPNILSNLIETNGATYPNIANLEIGLPNIVGRVNLLHQAAPIVATNLYVPFVSGLYRAVIYVSITAAGTSGTITPELLWNDGQTTRTQYGQSVPVTGGFCSFELTVEAYTGIPIQYAINFNSIIGTPQYSLFISLERLS